MKPFTYVRAHEVSEAVEAADTHSRFLGGGTNLVDLMKHGIETPEVLIDLHRLPGASIESTDEGGLRVGAGVTNTDLANDARVRADWSVLSMALLSGATQQLRNKATTGGNFFQRTRCYYFYDTARACNKRTPGSGCDALGGFNRIHAILGASPHCIATHPSDMAVAMCALDARVVTRHPRGGRTIPVRELYLPPGDTPHRETVLEPDELVTHVELPAPIPQAHHVYRKARDRSSYAFALVSVAAILRIEDDEIVDAHLALGGVAPHPWHARRAEQVLVGAPATRKSFDEAARAELADAEGHGHNDFKIPLARRLLIAALSEAAGLEAACP